MEDSDLLLVGGLVVWAVLAWVLNIAFRARGVARQKRDLMLMAMLSVILVISGLLAMHHPNRSLAGCDFVWFGPSGFWSCKNG